MEPLPTSRANLAGNLHGKYEPQAGDRASQPNVHPDRHATLPILATSLPATTSSDPAVFTHGTLGGAYLPTTASTIPTSLEKLQLPCLDKNLPPAKPPITGASRA